MEAVLSGQILAIVEDDELIRSSLADYFGKENTVHTYERAEDLIEALPTLGTVNIFILDYKLPEMDGITLFKTIKPQHGEAKFVCISGEMSVELVQEAESLGFDSLILKPFDFRILEQNIVELVA